MFEAPKSRTGAPQASSSSGLRKHELSEAKTAPGAQSTPSEQEAASGGQSGEVSTSSLKSSTLL